LEGPGSLWEESQPEERLTKHEPPTQVRRAALATQRIEAFRGQILQARAVVFEQRLAQRDLKPVMDLSSVPQAYRSAKHLLGDSIDSLVAKDLTCESEAIDLADGAPIREISKKIGNSHELLPLVSLPSMADAACHFGRAQGFDPLIMRPAPNGATADLYLASHSSQNRGP